MTDASATRARDLVRERIGRGAELRDRLARGTAVGTFLIELPHTRAVRALALAGLDFVVVDMEHSGCDFSDLAPLVAEGQACGMAMLVRVWGEDVGLIGKALDAGANGVMVPHVATPARAREVVEQARFAPAGTRGYSPLVSYGALRDPQAELNAATLVLVQIEGAVGLSNTPAIAATPGVDGVFVGPYDLAESLGTPSDIGSPAVLEAAARVAAAVPDDGLLGIYMDDPARSDGWARTGFRLQCIGFDAQLLLHRAQEIVERSARRPGIPDATAEAATVRQPS